MGAQGPRQPVNGSVRQSVVGLTLKRDEPCS